MSAEVEDSLADLLRSIDRANMADTYDEQAQAILSSDWLAARDAARDAALREKLTVEVEARAEAAMSRGADDLTVDAYEHAAYIIRGAAQ